MSVGYETIDVIEPWLFTRLSTDAALTTLVGNRISNTLAPAGIATPYVSFAMASVRDKTTADGTRIWVDAIYDVKAIGAGASWLPLRPIVDRLDALLGAGRGLTADYGGGRLELVRDREIAYPEVNQALQFRHLGAQYRIKAYRL